MKRMLIFLFFSLGLGITAFGENVDILIKNATVLTMNSKKEIIENGVVVRNRSNQPLCENCLRISIGTKEETEQIIELLKTFNNAEKSIIYR